MDTFKLKEVLLGPEAIRYIRENLREGKTLARYLSERQDLDRGRVITPLPVGVDTTALDLSDFTTGGKIPEPPPAEHLYATQPDGSRVRLVPVPNTNLYLATQIHGFLSNGPHRMCIFEDALALATDYSVAPATTRLLIFRDEVYHFLSDRDTAWSKIEETMKEALSISPPLIGVLTFVAPECDLSSKKREATLDELKAFAGRAEKIIVGAYDGESYLVWNKPSSR